MSKRLHSSIMDSNGSCEVKIGKKDSTKIKDCECSVEVEFPIGRCSTSQCEVEQHSLFEDAKIQCTCIPECTEMLYYIT